MNAAQKAVLVRLREIVEETPKSGAWSAGGRSLHVSAFARAFEARADDMLKARSARRAGGN